LKQTLRIAILLTFACAALASFSNFAQAQKIDVAFGVSTTLAPSASSVGPDDTTHAPASLAGGAFPGFSGDVIFWHNLGLGGEVFFRGSQASNYDTSFFGSGINDRPIFYNFDGVYSPKIASHTRLELVAGFGGLSTRIYESNGGGPVGGGVPVESSHHFAADFGGGIKFYPKGGFFIRPEARLYLIPNNTNFSSLYAVRVGASIGYTFGGH